MYGKMPDGEWMVWFNWEPALRRALGKNGQDVQLTPGPDSGLDECMETEAGPVEIGSRLELFVDEALIEDTKGEIRQVLNRPVSAGTVLRMDAPWEGNTSFYPNIVEVAGKYWMYYRGVGAPEYVVRKHLEPGEAVMEDRHPETVCLAESPDGVHWKKPELGLREWEGSKANNIVLLADDFAKRVAHNFTVFVDGNPEVPESERFKAVGGVHELYGFVSPDGLNWKPAQEEPILRDGKFDSQNVVFWDAERGHYVAVYRDFIHGVRTIKTATSPDFRSWPPGEWADFGDIPDEQLYTNATEPYFRAPHLYLSFPKRYLPFRTLVHDGKNNGLSDGVFMSSRDGVHWRRFEEAFIRPGRSIRNWIHRTTAAARGIVQTAPDEISLYVLRHYTYPTCHVERMTLRLDGFASMQAGARGGEVRTRPLRFGTGADLSGKITQLELNYATSAAGSLRVEIQDEAGHPIPGFALEDSPLLYGDVIDQPVDWVRPGTRTDQYFLNSLAEKPVRLRFVLKDADLYAFRFRTLDRGDLPEDEV